MRIYAEGREYRLDPDDLTNVDALALEEATGWTFAEWAELVDGNDIRAVTSAIWLVRRQTEPGLAVGDVVFRLSTLRIDNGAVAAAGGAADGAGDESPVGKAEGPSPETSTAT